MAILCPTDVLVWNTKKPGRRIGVAIGDAYLLNSNRIIEMRVRTANTVKFFFANDPDDPRDSPDYIECTDSIATWEFAHNIVPTSKFATLDLYPHLNLTGTPVSTKIEWSSIAYCYATPKDDENDVCRIVYYRQDWRRVEAIVDMTWLALLFLQTA